MKKIFVAGIGTDVGKTVVSAVLVEALQADYWKPVQAGDLPNSDTLKVKALIDNTRTVCHPETYRLTRPISPHAAAEIDRVKIDVPNIVLPKTANHLIIEGAGGLMVPLSEEILFIDLIQALAVEVVLVSRNYLGSINHTLLSVEALLRREIQLAGIVFNGTPNPRTEDVILRYTGSRMLGRVSEEPRIDKETIRKYARAFRGVFGSEK